MSSRHLVPPSLPALQDLMDRQQFEVVLQAAAGGRIVARETLRAYRKNVLAKCYGGDVSRCARSVALWWCLLHSAKASWMLPAGDCNNATNLQPCLPETLLPACLPSNSLPLQQAQAAGEAEGREEAHEKIGQRGGAAGGVPRTHEGRQHVMWRGVM